MDSNKDSEASQDNDANEAKHSNKKRSEKELELRNNVRHITQLGMNWYAFFMTLNYATLGWLAGSSSINTPLINTPLIGIVAGLFLFQNGLGIVGICRVRKAAEMLIKQVSRHERVLIPGALYKSIARYLIVVMSLLMAAWLGIAIWWFCKWWRIL